MKIVDRVTFLAMPSGTLYSKYAPCYLEALYIKGETWGNDWLAQDINDAVDCAGSSEFSDVLLKAEKDGESFNLDFHCESRDGCFEDGQLFAVWEPNDVAALIARLQESLAQAAGLMPPIDRRA